MVLETLDQQTQTYYLFDALSVDHQVYVIYTDFTKAFDTINHNTYIKL